MAVLCVLLAAYHAWGLDALVLWWLVIVVAAVLLLGRRGLPQWAMAICIAATVPLVWLIIRDVRGPSSRMWQCKNQLHMLALGTINYAGTKARLLPAASQMPNGEKGLSWRVEILPYLEEQALYSKFNTDEAWDGPTNQAFIDSMPRLFRCPEERHRSDRYTSYLAFQGAETLWPEGQLIGSDISDGASNTVLFSEMHDSNITWSEPRDFDADNMDWRVNASPRSSPSSMHGPVTEYLDGSRRRRGTGMVNVAMADGSVRTFSSDIDPEVLKQLANRRDGLPHSSQMPTEAAISVPD
jgi:prepilin-type processing-associated H-X9-DG protein